MKYCEENLILDLKVLEGFYCIKISDKKILDGKEL